MKRFIMVFLTTVLLLCSCSNDKEKSTPQQEPKSGQNVILIEVDRPITMADVPSIDKGFVISWKAVGHILTHVPLLGYPEVKPFMVRRNINSPATYLTTWHNTVEEAIKAFNTDPYTGDTLR